MTSATRFTCGGTPLHSIERRQQIGRGRRGAWRQQMPLREQRARLRDLARAAGFDQHARQPRMQRQAADLFTDRGQMQRIADRGLRIADRDQAEACEQRQRRVERVFARTFEPLERARIAAPGDDVERGARQIDAVNLRLAMRAQAIARVPQAPHHAGRQASGAPGPLIRGVGRDALGLEAVDAAVGVVARDLLQAGVDHRRHARHRQRRLGDVGGDDDPAAR